MIPFYRVCLHVDKRGNKNKFLLHEVVQVRGGRHFHNDCVFSKMILFTIQGPLAQLVRVDGS